MLAERVLDEFRTAWLPHASDSGLARLVELLAADSPMLIHGAFARCHAMGCLATHLAWHHPRTRHLNAEAGVTWLTRVARLNPALSNVVIAWDGSSGQSDLRRALLRECRTEQEHREGDVVDCDCGELATVE